MKDLKILSELDQNSRQSISSIARNVGLSKQVTTYRLRSLLDNNVINTLLPIIDAQRLGFTYYNLYFQVRQKKEKDFINYLKVQPEVSWLVTSVGKWNILAAVLVKDPTDIHRLLEQLQERFNESIEGKTFQIIIDAVPCEKKYLPRATPINELTPTAYFGKREPYTLDTVDKNILKELNNNVRLSTLKIAEKLLIAPNTVKSRIKSMQTNGLIQRFTIKINPTKLGYEWYYVLLDLESATKEQKRQLTETLKQSPHVVFIANAIGTQNLNVDFHVKNQLQLQELLHTLQDDYSFIKSYEHLLITKEHKCTFLPETMTVA